MTTMLCHVEVFQIFSQLLNTIMYRDFSFPQFLLKYQLRHPQKFSCLTQCKDIFYKKYNSYTEF